jgi:hypothetical protein
VVVLDIRPPGGEKMAKMLTRWVTRAADGCRRGESPDPLPAVAAGVTLGREVV